MSETDLEPLPIELSSQPPQGRRKWFSRLIFVFLGSTVVLGAAIVGLTRTTYGLDLLRNTIEWGASVVLQGQLKIGELGGPLPSQLVLRNIKLSDDESYPALELDELRLRWTPSALWRKNILEVDAIELTNPHIFVRTSSTGSVNWLRILPKKSPTTTSSTSVKSPSRIGFELKSAKIHNGRVSYLNDEISQAELNNIELNLDGSLLSQSLTAQLQLGGQLHLQHQPHIFLKTAELNMVLAKQEAHIHTSGHIQHARWTGEMNIEKLLDFNAASIKTSSLAIQIPNLKALSGSIDGDLDLRTSLTGSLTSPSVQGAFVLNKLRQPGIHIGKIWGRWEVDGGLAAPCVKAELSFKPLTISNRQIDSIDSTLRAQLKDSEVLLHIPKLEIRTGPLNWRAKNTHIRLGPTGTLSIDSFALHSQAGRFNLTLNAHGLTSQMAQHIEGAVKIRQLDLGALPRSLLPELGTLEGIISAQLTTQGLLSQPKAQLNAQVQSFRMRPAGPAIDLHLRGQTLRRTLFLKTNLKGLAQIARLRLFSPLPDDFTDGEAWSRILKSNPIRRLELDISALNIERLFGFLNPKASPFKGTINSQLNIAQSGRQAHLKLEGHDLKILANNAADRLRSRIFIQTHFDSGQLNAHGRIDINPLGLGTWTATVAGPQRLFDLKGWKNLNRSALKNFELSLIGLRLKALEKLKLASGISGELTAKVERQSPNTLLDAQIVAKEVQSTGLRGKWNGIINLHIPDRLQTTSDKAHAHARFTLDELTDFVQLNLETPIAAKQLESFGRDKKTSIPLEAQVIIKDPSHPEKLRLHARGSAQRAGIELNGRVIADGFPLDFLSHLGLPLGLKAQFHSSLRFSLTPQRFEPHGWLELRDLRVLFPSPILDPLHHGLARLELSPQQAQLTMNARSSKGTLSVTGNAHWPSEGGFRAQSMTQLNALPINVGTRGHIDMAIALRAKQASSRDTNIDIQLQNGFIQLATEPLRYLHPIGLPSEVSFGAPPRTSASEPPPSQKPQSPVPVRIRINTESPIDVRGGPVNARLNVDLISRTQQVEDNGTFGRVWAPNGTVTLFERRYQIERCEVILDGETPPRPRLDIRLSHTFEEDSLQLLVSVSGTAQKPVVRMSSIPPRYSEPELLQIFGGTAPSELGRSSDRSPEAQAANAAINFFTGELQNKLGKALAFDTISLDVSDQGFGGLTLGRWITRQIYLAYRYKSQPTPLENQYEALLQYRFAPGWMVELALGLVRNELDLWWQKQF